VQQLLARWGGLPLADTVLVSVLLVAVPALALAQVPLAAGLRVERLPAYWGSLATLWLLGTAAWLVGTRDGGGSAAIGFVPLPWLSLIVAATSSIPGSRAPTSACSIRSARAYG
jgi:hypothetical protein